MKSISLRPAILLLAAAGFLSAQTLSVDKTSLSFSAQTNGPSVSQTVDVTSSGSTIPFFMNSSTSWLSASPITAGTPAKVTVTASPQGLAPGIHSGQFTVLGGQGTAPTIQVTFFVGNIGVAPSSLQFDYQQGASTPAAKAFAVTGQPTAFNVTTSTTSAGSWLQAAPSTGVAPTTVNVTIASSVLGGLAPNTYTGKVTITPTSGPSNSPIDVPVTLIVTGAPAVSVTPSTVNINYQLGGANNTPQQTVTLAATGNQPVAFSFTNATNDPNPQGKNWVSFSPPSGTIPAGGTTTVTIGYNDSAPQLPAGNWNGSITLNSNGVPSQITIPIKLLIAPNNTPLLNVPSATLAFNYQVGGAIPPAKTVIATSTNVLPGSTTGQMTLALSASSTGGWLTLPSTTGSTGNATPISVTVNPVGLNPGNYTGTVTVAGIGAGNPAQTIPVTLTVANEAQVTASVGGCNTLNQSCPLIFPLQIAQIPPQPQTVRVSSSTGATLTYSVTKTTATCNSTWLVLGGATTGATENTFTIAVDGAGIAGGSKCEGTVTISGANVVNGTPTPTPNSPITIPVTLYVSNTALLSVNPLALSFAAQVQQGASVPTQIITVNSTSPAEQISFSVSTEMANSGSWLIAGPSSGSTASGSNQITVLVQPGLLSAGTYTGTVRITAAGTSVANSPVEVPVNFTITESNMTVTPASLSFSQTAGGTAPATQTVSVNSSGRAINWTATVSTGGTGNWLTVSPANGSAAGSSPSTVTVTANGTGLQPGTYNGTITFSAPLAGGSPTTVNVTLVVTPGTISATPTTLTFTQLQGGTAPAAQTVSVAGTPSTLNYTVSASTNNGSGWLTVSPSTGSTPGTVSVSANGASLGAGTYTGTVRITANGTATGSPIDIPVTLTVIVPQTITATPTTLNFNYTLGNAAPANQTVQLQATAGAAAFTATTTVTSGGSWLSVTPTSGTTPASLTVAVNPTGLAAGSYTGTISVASPVSSTPVAASITVNLVVIATVPPVLTAVRNAGSYAVGPISGGENIVIFGTNLGPAELVKGTLNAAGAFNTTLAETQITFDGLAAPIIYVWGPQTSVMVPYEVAGRVSVTMRVIFKGVQSEPLQVSVAQTSPGIYTLNQSGSGPGAIVNQDFNVNTATAPAPKLSVVAVYMTGEGVTTPQPANGAIAPTNGSGLFRTTLPVTATVGGLPARVLYYGSAPGIVYGVMQVNVEIPAGAPSGAAVPLQISVGSTPTQNGVTVAVQ